MSTKICPFKESYLPFLHCTRTDNILRRCRVFTTLKKKDFDIEHNARMWYFLHKILCFLPY